jgi:hypothetical protein
VSGFLGAFSKSGKQINKWGIFDWNNYFQKGIGQAAIGTNSVAKIPHA